MSVARTLQKTVLKSLCVYHALLIVPNSSTVCTSRLIAITSITGRQWFIAQQGFSKLLYRITVVPLSNGGIGNVVGLVVGVEFVTFLAANSQSAIPIDVQVIPGRVTKYFLVRHGFLRSCRQDHSQLLVVLT